MSNKKFTIGLVVAIVIAIGGYLFPRIQPVSTPSTNDLGSATPGTRWPHGITVGLQGNSPTNLADIKVGACNLLGMDTSHAASSSKPYDCAVTGVISTDLVTNMILATTTNFSGGASYFTVIAAKASTTAGYITAIVYNNGPSAVPSVTSVGSSTVYSVVKTQ